MDPHSPTSTSYVPAAFSADAAISFAKPASGRYVFRQNPSLGEHDMAEQKESSVLFSLKELMTLEEDRIKQEDDDRKKKEQAEVQARLDGERRAREAEEERVRQENERKRQEDQRTREEQARVEAIRQGEVEKARKDAENQA